MIAATKRHTATCLLALSRRMGCFTFKARVLLFTQRIRLYGLKVRAAILFLFFFVCFFFFPLILTAVSFSDVAYTGDAVGLNAALSSPDSFFTKRHEDGSVDTNFALYSDAGITQHSDHLQHPLPNVNDMNTIFNSNMAKERVAIEWAFGK